MARQEEVKKLISNLGGQVVAEKISTEPWAGPADISSYQALGICPDDYMLVGHSFNAEYRIVGTPMESKRAGLIAILLENKGDRRHCVALREAIAYEGFAAILGTQEQDTLAKLPPDALIGPAYDRLGVRIRTAFAVWVKAVVQKEKPRLFVGAKGKGT